MINYRGTPLFGEDSSVSHTSEFFAIAGTVLFWLLFLIFSLVIKPQVKKQYKEVQIVLSSTPVVQKTEEAPAPAEAASASAASSEPLVAETVEPPAPKTEPVKSESPAPKAPAKPAAKKEPAKTQTQPKASAKPAAQQPAKSTPVQKSEPVEQVLYQDPMEAFAKQTSQQTKKEFDWSSLDDDEPTETSQTSQTRTVQNNAPAFSGSAGTAAAADSSKVTSSSSNSSSRSDSASSSTSSALQGIRNSTFKGNAANGVQSETSAKTKTSGSGKVEMEMSNGRSRALLKPASPVINLSAQAAATIDASITVSISFKVNEKGNVSGVTISPASAFKDIVKQEITGQLLEWLFEPDDYSATATFEYKIVKK